MEENKEIIEETNNDQINTNENNENLNIVEAQEGESNEGFSIPWGFIIVIGVLILLFVACVIVIKKTGGPIEWKIFYYL